MRQSRISANLAIFGPDRYSLAHPFFINTSKNKDRPLPSAADATPRFSNLAVDLVVALLTAAFCWLAVRGLLVLSPLGVGMSSDLQNYAQILEATLHPELFVHDPVGALLPRDPGVPNMLTELAPFFSGANMAESLILAGGTAIFCQIFGWYVFGRLVFGSPALSAFLAVVGSTTFYWAFGTYWGACHEEAVPRIFFNALWPFFLLAGTWAMRSVKIRLALSLALGLSIFVHSVSALMLGGMFLTVFLLRPVKHRNASTFVLSANSRRPRPGGLLKHLASTFACTFLYAVPVAAFLILRTPINNPDPASLELLRQMFELRFARDWGDIWGGFAKNVLPLVVDFPLLPLGALALIFILYKQDRLEGPARDLPLLMPFLLVGMLAVVLVCQAEIVLAPRFSRMSMSLEILRGTRFLVPMSLLCLAIALSLYIHRIPRLLSGAVALAAALVLFLVSPDKVVLAARMEVRDALGLEREMDAQAIVEAGQSELEALDAVEKNVPRDETVFAPMDAMSVRYVLKHPLEPVHKDGNILYHTRSMEPGRAWLDIQTGLRKDPRSALEAWGKSPARWMLSPRANLPEDFGRNENETLPTVPKITGKTDPHRTGAALKNPFGHAFSSPEKDAGTAAHTVPFDIVFANRDWVLLKKRG